MPLYAGLITLTIGTFVLAVASVYAGIGLAMLVDRWRERKRRRRPPGGSRELPYE